MAEQEKEHHYIAHEPKFCRCRVCHEHFYGETIADAREACIEHGKEAHPDWGSSARFCPDWGSAETFGASRGAGMRELKNATMAFFSIQLARVRAKNRCR